MNDLIVFVRARLDEDVRSLGGARSIGGCTPRYTVATMQGTTVLMSADRFREVDATRLLLDDLLTDQHGDSMWGAKSSCGAALDDRGMRLDPNDFAARRHPCDCGRDERVSRRIRQLALPYATHPDYRDEWRP